MVVSSTALILIDVQKAFTSPDGSLCTHFGAKEIQPIRETLSRICAVLPKAIGSSPVVMVRSEYRLGQFVDGASDHGLSCLCVPSRGVDCEWSEEVEPLVDSKVSIVTKHFHSAFSSPDFRAELDRLLNSGVKNFVFAGFLATSCVKKSAIDSANYLRDLDADVSVCLDLAGARASSFPDRIGQLMGELKAAGIVVKSSFGECLM